MVSKELSKRITIAVIVIVSLGLVGAGYVVLRGGSYSPPAAEQTPVNLSTRSPDGSPWQILHVMSYHTPWEWTESQLQGFKDGLKPLEAEFTVYEMDTKQRSSEEWKQQAAVEAKEKIDTIKPDLVYTNDDNAQKYVVASYVNTDTPFVFSGVNADPSVYGFTGSTNVTGVLEQPHFEETIRFLRQIVPSVKRIVIVYDDDPTWAGVTALMKTKLSNIPDVEVVAWDKISTFEEFQEKMAGYQTTVDAVGLLGIHTFKDTAGNNVPWQDVLRWTTENSTLPDFSFFADRIDYGTLVSVAVSGYEQGLAAGRKARVILGEGTSVSEIPMEPTTKGQPHISLARAKKLGITIKSSLLLSAKVIEAFAWEGK